ncbi:hypothetical protein VT84_03315 [Gemmata sp. SH-PL17]|uniref:hypothetical protein n=1 Tax=Gemmata sp. SH-PL17 TaxID=1630693 RepID=UPI00078C0C20|nr:hypothetical protein [Gemmata sp. SH-PL17]AMV23412.1 hypothetical protein VT84_03315 [Gemmata sp. SH-PL17]
MSEDVYGLSARAADRLEQLLNQSDGGGRSSRRASGSGRIQMVKCLSATAAGATGVLSECYPAQVVFPSGSKQLPAETGGLVLLTVIGSDGNAAAAVADQTYLCIVAGDAVGDESGSGSAQVAARPRAFAIAGSPAAPSNWMNSVRLVTTTALPANTYSNGSSGVGATLTANANGIFPFTDGFTVNTGDDLLIAAEGTASRNGVYTVTDAGSPSTPWILTRRADNDESAEFVGKIVPVRLGTVSANTLWHYTNYAPPTMGSTAITIHRVSGDVNGPTASVTDSTLALFDGTSGRFIKASIFYVNSTSLRSVANFSGGTPMAELGAVFGSSYLALRNDYIGQQTTAQLSCGQYPGVMLQSPGAGLVGLESILGEPNIRTYDGGGLLLNCAFSIGGSTRNPRYSVNQYQSGGGILRHNGINTTFTVKRGGVDHVVTVVGGIVVGINVGTDAAIIE